MFPNSRQHGRSYDLPRVAADANCAGPDNLDQNVCCSPDFAHATWQNSQRRCALEFLFDLRRSSSQLDRRYDLTMRIEAAFRGDASLASVTWKPNGSALEKLTTVIFTLAGFRRMATHLVGTYGVRRS